MSHGTKIILIGLLISLGLAIIASLFASSLPDGLEWVAEKLGFLDKETEIVKTPMPDYEVPHVKYTGMSKALAGIVGTLIVFCITILLMFVLKKRRGSN
jgi:hypothetical protein